MPVSIDLTLDRIQKLASCFPPYTRPTCHVAGTNGKGSVSVLLSSIFRSSSPALNVGRFNSPHLTSVHDCVVINNEPVALDVYSATRNEVEDADRSRGIGASNFELLTLTALLVFERMCVDIVVVEVGMGGRLDATNIIPDQCILVSALTAVDLDHEAILGGTVAGIAREKAGIARRDRPFVIGPQKYPEVEEAVRSVVTERGGRIEIAPAATKREWSQKKSASYSISLSPSSFRVPPPQPVRITMPYFSEDIDTVLPLCGGHQLENLGIAATVISTLLTHSWCIGSSINLRERITPSSISQGVKDATWPGRLSFHKVFVQPVRVVGSASASSPCPLIVLVDGAHNPASSSTLAAFIADLLVTRCNPHIGDVSKPRTVSLTYILAFSHAPPKSPLHTLAPLLSSRFASNIRVKTNVAMVKFTPPDGMPWAKPTPPNELRRVVLAVHPNANVWVPSDNDDSELGNLHRAFEWATTNQDSEENLVILTGSLYLVADFYRLMRDGVLVSGE